MRRLLPLRRERDGGPNGVEAAALPLERERPARRVLRCVPPLADPDYWLANCHGFLVDSSSGEEIGIVDDVRVDPRSGQALELLVAAGWFGRRRLWLPIDEVEWILVPERRLIVSHEIAPQRQEPPAEAR